MEVYIKMKKTLSFLLFKLTKPTKKVGSAMTYFKNKPFHFLLSLVLVLSTQPIKADTDFTDFVKGLNDEEKICVPYEGDGGGLKCLSFFVKEDVLHVEKCARDTNSVKSKIYCKSAGEMSLDELAVFTERICSVHENKEACATLRNNLTLEYEETNLVYEVLIGTVVGIAVGAGAVSGFGNVVMSGVLSLLGFLALAGGVAVTEEAGAFARTVAGTAVGAVAGAVAGAGAGAGIGSVIPIVGTVLGAVIGAIIGSFGGTLGAVVLEDQYRKKEMIATIQSKLNENPLKEQDIDPIIAKLTQVMQKGLNEISLQDIEQDIEQALP